MSHTTYNVIESENPDFPQVYMNITDNSISGTLASKTIRVYSPFNIIFKYTLDGSIPTSGSYLYTNPITIETETVGESISARILAINIKDYASDEQDVVQVTL